MTRLEKLQAQLDELLNVRSAEHTELLGLADTTDDLTDAQSVRWADLNERFDNKGRHVSDDDADVLRNQINLLVAVRDAPAPARVEIPAPVAQSGNGAGLTLHNPDTSDPFERGREFGQPTTVRSNALRSIERADGVPDSIRGALERSVRSLDNPNGALSSFMTASLRPEYRSFMAKYITGRESACTVDERNAAEAVRAVNITNDASGGYAQVPTYDLTLILTGDHDGLAQPMWRQLASTRQIVGGDTWKGLTTAGVTASWDGEFEEVSDDSPTFAQPSIEAKKADAFVAASVEAWEDIPGLEAEVRTLFDVAKADLEAAAFSNSVVPSAKAPYGLIYRLDGTASEVTPTSSEAFALADIDKVVAALPARHRQRAVFMADMSTYLKAQGLAAAANDLSVWNHLDIAGPGILRGRPAYENPSMRGWADINAAATADNFILLLGDFSAYYIIDRVGMSVEFIPNLFDTAHNRPNGSRGLMMRWRVGADVVDTNAFRVLNVATAA